MVSKAKTVSCQGRTFQSSVHFPSVKTRFLILLCCAAYRFAIMGGPSVLFVSLLLFLSSAADQNSNWYKPASKPRINPRIITTTTTTTTTLAPPTTVEVINSRALVFPDSEGLFYHFIFLRNCLKFSISR